MTGRDRDLLQASTELVRDLMQAGKELEPLVTAKHLLWPSAELDKAATELESGSGEGGGRWMTSREKAFIKKHGPSPDKRPS